MRKFDQSAAKKRIQAARVKHNLSQEELGNRFGMSRAGYSAAENIKEKVFFTPVQIINLKYELNIPYDFIFEGIDKHAEFIPESTPSGELDIVICRKEKEHLENTINTQAQYIESLKGQIELYERLLKK